MKTARALIIALVLAISGATASAQVVGNGSASGGGGGGGVASVTAGDSSVTIGGTVTNPTVALSTTQPNANTWSLTQTFNAAIFGGTVTLNGATTANNFFTVNFNATTGCAGAITNAPIAEVCFLGTSTIGFVLGTVSGNFSTAGNSQTFAFSRGGATTCGILLNSSGVLELGSGAACNSISTLNNPFSTGTGAITSGKDFMSASCSFTTGTSGTMPAAAHGCKITIPASPFTFTLTYAGTAYATQAICGLNDETTLNGARVSACTTTSATITGTVASDIVDFTVTGI